MVVLVIPIEVDHTGVVTVTLQEALGNQSVNVEVIGLGPNIELHSSSSSVGADLHDPAGAYPTNSTVIAGLEVERSRNIAPIFLVDHFLSLSAM